jgi:hypothetical protein
LDTVNIGIGASMAMRRDAVDAVGGFDALLGAGARFQSAEDTDLTLRVLLAGYEVRRLAGPGVDHFGARSTDDFRALNRGSMLGVGACCGKLVRSGSAAAVRFTGGIVWRCVLVPGMDALHRGRRPPVLGRAVNLAKGFVLGLAHAQDRRTRTFR